LIGHRDLSKSLSSLHRQNGIQYLPVRGKKKAWPVQEKQQFFQVYCVNGNGLLSVWSAHGPNKQIMEGGNI